jgi:hypothetical protein
MLSSSATGDSSMDQKARATRRNPLVKPLGDERKERRRRAQQAPQCPYLLKDSEIHEDLNVLRRVGASLLGTIFRFSPDSLQAVGGYTAPTRKPIQSVFGTKLGRR